MGDSRFILGLAALALGAISLQAQAAAPEPLQLAPSSKWVLDYAPDSCALTRTFAGDGHEVSLEIRQFSPGEDFQVVVESRTLAGRQKNVRTRFEPDDDWSKPITTGFTKSGEAMDAILYTDSLWPVALKESTEPRTESTELRTDEARDSRERSITGLLVAESFKRTMRLQTGEMHKPMKAMRTCLGELLTEWGLDPAVQRTLSRPLRPLNFQSWGRQVQEAYPLAMLRDGQGAEIQLRVIVGPDGKPTSCAVLTELARPDFNSAACGAMMKFARYEPALDAQGTPVASYTTPKIVYRTN